MPQNLDLSPGQSLVAEATSMLPISTVMKRPDFSLAPPILKIGSERGTFNSESMRQAGTYTPSESVNWGKLLGDQSHYVDQKLKGTCFCFSNSFFKSQPYGNIYISSQK